MNNRVYNYIICILLGLIVLFVGCKNNTIYAKDIVYADKSEINIIKIENLNSSRDITDRSEITGFIDSLYQIELRKLSKEEELEILDNGERLKQGNHNMITLFKDDQVVGLVLLLSEEEIILFDTKTVNTNSRTDSYCNIEKNSNSFKNIKVFIDNME